MSNYDIPVNTNNFLVIPYNKYDEENIVKAKQWYFRFTGKKYDTGDVKELMEMYNMIQKSLDTSHKS